jgi:hypothetical protein
MCPKWPLNRLLANQFSLELGSIGCFFAFDLLTYDGKDLRTERLLDRKQELRQLLAKISPLFPLRYADHVEGSGTALFQRICELDMEDIVAKQKFGPYVTEREHSTWFKILNRKYSQKDGREELFGLVLSGSGALDGLARVASSAPAGTNILNARLESARTPVDWLTRDTAIVDAFLKDPLCFPQLQPASFE